MNRIECGIQPIDVLMGGGFKRGSLNSIIAEHGTFKTSLSYAIADSFCRKGYRVVFFTSDGNYPYFNLDNIENKTSSSLRCISLSDIGGRLLEALPVLLEEPLDVIVVDGIDLTDILLSNDKHSVCKLRHLSVENDFVLINTIQIRQRSQADIEGTFGNFGDYSGYYSDCIIKSAIEGNNTIKLTTIKHRWGELGASVLLKFKPSERKS